MVSRKSARRSLVAASIVVVAACQDASTPSGPAAPEPSLSRLAAAQQAARAFDRASAEVLALPGTVFADYDEVNGRLVFGVEHAAAIKGVSTALSRLGLAVETYEIKITAPITFAATLRDRWRPTQGGIQIHFGNFLCTMGFNANDGTQRSFITNSHCTNTQGGVESTQYFQPTSTVDGGVIATEVEDPGYVRNIAGCPRGKRCRRSDASRAVYNSSAASTLGAIAHTSAPNNGSLEVTGTFTITGEDSRTSFPTGTVINKVGRTTGWTQGTVSNTCATVNVSGTSIAQICQTLVTRNGTIVGSGDSGSPVFTGTGNVALAGILWGGSSDGRTFVFSPLANIRQELGPIAVR